MGASAITAGLWLALLTAPAEPVAPNVEAIEADRRACKDACAQTEAEGTDRTTCELVCDTRADNRKEGPSVTRWKTEKQMGGPAPGVPVGPGPSGASKTTTTTTTRTTTTHTTTQAPKPAPRAAGHRRADRTPRTDHAHAAAWRRRAELARCQARCDTTANDPARWRCKLRCLQPRSPGASPVAVPLGEDAAKSPTR